MVQTITTIADSFAQYHPNYRIRVNDIGLPFGGGFDIGGNWEADIVDQYPDDARCNDTGHCEHREGKTVDISFLVRTQSGQDVEMTPEQREDIRSIIESLVGAPLEHGHYHIRLE